MNWSIEKFNKTLLPIKLDFKTSEACRAVLVNGMPIEVACSICGLYTEKEKAKVVESLELFKQE